MSGPQAAVIAESFPGRMRYSGASLGYQLSSVIAGGPAPFITISLLGGTIQALPSRCSSPCALVSLASTAMLEVYTNRDVPGEAPPYAPR